MTVSQPPTVPPHVAADVATFARVLVAAARTWQMYSAQHPASSAALRRLSKSIDALRAYEGLTVGVTPKRFLVNGDVLAADGRVAEAAELLHDHDVLRLRFPQPATPAELTDLLGILAHDPDTVKARGGPARMWAEFGHRGIEIEQIDYDALMAARISGAARASSSPVPDTETARAPGSPTARDGIWNAIVRSIATGQPAKGLSIQRRLLEISRSPEAIEALTSEAIQGDDEPGRTGAVAGQAATVLTAFQRLVRAVEAQAPGEIENTLGNLTEAAKRLDPHLVTCAVAESAESGVGIEVTTAMGRWLDDDQIAKMLAGSLSIDWRASARVAAALGTLAPDPARQERVLRLAHGYPVPNSGGTVEGADGPWLSVEQMLSKSRESAYTSTEYSMSLQDAESRSYQLSLTTPAQMDLWIRTVSTDSVRSMSCLLLLDLLGLEEQPDKMVELADDLAAMVGDLLMSADTAEAERATVGLGKMAAGPSPPHRTAASGALTAIAGSASLREMAATLADFDDAQLAWFNRFCHQLGTPVLQTLMAAMPRASEGEGRVRLGQVIVRFGDAAVAPLARMLEAEDWLVRRAALRCIENIGTEAAIALLEPLVSAADARMAHESVIALVRIGQPAALRPLAAALHGGPTPLRRLIVDALAAARDRRASPLLAATLNTVDPVGRDHALAVRLLDAIRLGGDDQSVPAVAHVLRAWNWLRPSRTNRIKRLAAGVLASFNTEAAIAALDDARRNGDGLAKMHARRAKDTRS